MNKDLSIIIPHFNSPKSLDTLLRTIPDCKKIEIIVIDDKSNSDLESLYALREEFHQRVTFLNNETDKKGAGVCRNIGLEKATGEWLLFADADDYFVENFYTSLKKYFSSGYDIIFFPPTSIDMQTKETGERHVVYSKLAMEYLERPDIENEWKLRYKYFSPCSKLIRKDFVLENKIKFEEILVSNDVMFSIKAGHHARTVGAGPEIIYCITRNSGTLTSNISKERFKIRLHAQIRLHKYLKSTLTKEAFKVVRIGGRGFLLDTIHFGFGISVLISTFFVLVFNGIPLLYKDDFDPNKLKAKVQREYKKFSRS
jgi:glycosyltransferase involved in cell wall biosynthesis